MMKFKFVRSITKPQWLVATAAMFIFISSFQNCGEIPTGLNLTSTATLGLEIMANSTSAQSVCSDSNQIEVILRFDKEKPLLCTDVSELSKSYSLGRVCEGGVEIKSFTVKSAAVPCEKTTICGVAPSSVEEMPSSSASLSFLKLTYKNLPWGCSARVLSHEDNSTLTQTTTSSTPSLDNSQSMNFEVKPPTCPYCRTTQTQTCGSCPEPPVHWEVQWSTCSGGVQTATSALCINSFAETVDKSQCSALGTPQELGQIRTCGSAPVVTLSHQSNHNAFTISWKKGSIIGNCQIRLTDPTGKTAIVNSSGSTPFNCDADLANQTITLPSSITFAGGSHEIKVELISSVNTSTLIYQSSLKCSPDADGSAASTPSIDEDCNGVWDNLSLVDYQFIRAAYPAQISVNGTQYPIYMASQSDSTSVDQYCKENGGHSNASLDPSFLRDGGSYYTNITVAKWNGSSWQLISGYSGYLVQAYCYRNENRYF